jgi:hypothetical protein
LKNNDNDLKNNIVGKNLFFIDFQDDANVYCA